MADRFIPEEDMPEAFAQASPQSQRILRAAAARIALADEKIPCYLDFHDLDTNETALLVAMDFLEWKLRGGEMPEYLRERWDSTDSTGRDLIKDDFDNVHRLFVTIREYKHAHPADIEAKKRIRER